MVRKALKTAKFQVNTPKLNVLNDIVLSRKQPHVPNLNSFDPKGAAETAQM